MYAPTMTSVKNQTAIQKLERVEFERTQHLAFWQGVIEGLSDGILILDEQGEIIYANDRAKQICSQLHQELATNYVPPLIWKICQLFIENSSLFPDQTIVLSDEITAGNSDAFAVRVQRLNLERFDFCLLVKFENQSHSLQRIAIAEAQIYGLTPSETKVWLLYRANYTYKQIATALYITINTVKKHMKNIHAKRQAIFTTDNE